MPRIVGIDLGSSTVKVVRLETRARGGHEVLGYYEAPVPPPSEGQDGASTATERTSAALAELKARGQLDGDVFVTGLPGDAAAVRTLKFPFADAKKIADALPFALESEIPMDLDDIVLSWVVLGPSARARKERGHETEVLVAWAKKEAVQQILDLLAVHGIDPRHVHFDALALGDLHDTVLAPAEAAEGPTELRTPGGTVIEVGPDAAEPAVAVVDIGDKRTSVCVLATSSAGTRLVGAHTLLHGGADATRALARAIGLPLAEAERGKKKEAFIEVSGAKAQFPEQQHISDVLKSAYAPIVRRVRQIFQAAMSSARVRVVKVYVVGGGSRVLNLERHLSEELNVRVVRAGAVDHALRSALPVESRVDAPEAAIALAYALSGVPSLRVRPRVDFRVAEFAWKGDFDFLRERAPSLIAWAAVLVLLLGGSSVAQALVASSNEGALLEKELKICEEITGQKVESFIRCKALIDEKINGAAAFAVPERGAADTYLEVARRLPPAAEIKRKITELDITSERVKLRGLTSSYDAIDTMVVRLQGGRCFSLVEKGKAQSKGTDIDFQITITLDCAAAAGDGKEFAPPPAPTAESIKTSTTGAVTTDRPAITDKPAPDVSRSAQQYGTTPPAGDTGSPRAAEIADQSNARGKLTPEEIEERRERLRKLREEREARRSARTTPEGLNPVIGPRPPGASPRTLKRDAVPVDEGKEEE